MVTQSRLAVLQWCDFCSNQTAAWSHQTGCNEIQYFYGIFFLNDKDCIWFFSHCVAIQSKANILKIFNWGWQTQTYFSLRMSRPSATNSAIENTRSCTAQTNLIMRYHFLDPKGNISICPLGFSGERDYIFVAWRISHLEFQRKKKIEQGFWRTTIEELIISMLCRWF